MRIDSHQHFWQYNPVRDSWIDAKMSALQQDFLPEDIESTLQQHSIEGCIAVQADSSEEETQFLLTIADSNSIVKGVVGWLDLCDANIDDRLKYFSEYKKLKGLRHIVQAEEKGFMLRSDFKRGISALEKHNLTYDILIYPHQIEEAIFLIKQFPNQKFILDHCAKPYINQGKIKNWKRLMEQLSLLDNVACKVSGLTTEANWESWNSKQLEPYLDVVFNCFGTKRTLFGSDWPVSLLAGSYSQTITLIEHYIQRFTLEEQRHIMGTNAKKWYDIK